METIKVNMSPNPLDVQTIHASQNDGEARQWEFELHNNGELIDTSNVTEQLFFKAYKGGTEQLLPENTSTPTTTPILADIQYPDGLRTDQYFTYRETPTTVSNKARIKTIKGNTLVWNQLVRNGNLESTSGWGQGGSRSTLTVADNIGTATLVNVLSTTYQNYGDVQLVRGHKLLIHYEFKLPRTSQRVFGCENNNTDYMFGDMRNVPADTWITVNALHTVALGGAEKITICYFTTSIDGYQLGDQYQVRNLMVFDLTAMGLDSITDPSDFTSLFPLSYYSYNQGSLLSFMGNGIKTVGFNLFDQDSVLTSVGFVKQSDGSFYIQYPTSANYKVLFENKLKYSGQFFLVYKYKYANTTSQGCRFEVHYTDGTVDQIFASGSNDFVEVSFISRANKVVDYISGTYGSNIGTWWKDVCINISDPSKNGTYEPYTSSTLSLPISTYFPTGMKSAGNAYDELIPTKAITRIGAVDLGTLDWTLSSSTSHIFRGKLSGMNVKIPNASALPNALLANYQPEGYNPISANDNGYFAIGYRSYDEVDVIVIIDNNYSTQESFISHVSGQYLFYELATPTETPFTTASLVTENGEIPLSNEDGVLIGKCTEQLSENPGFIDAKIKLSDADGECYSNKLQLHVERSPQ